MSRISRVDTHGKLFRVAMFNVIVLTLVPCCVFQSSAFASEFTIYSSEGIQKINIPESAGPQKAQDNQRLVGDKCILNCEEVSKSHSTDKTAAKEASDSTERQGQPIIINVYPNEQYQSPYIFVPYGIPHRDHGPSDHPKPPPHPPINPITSGINDSRIPK
jgi:hypothetical protein